MKKRNKTKKQEVANQTVNNSEIIVSQCNQATKDYEVAFMQMSELKNRKAVYISKELHDDISHFINSIKNGELSIGAYIQHIIKDHFERYKDEIEMLYEKRYREILQKRFRKS